MKKIFAAGFMLYLALTGTVFAGARPPANVHDQVSASDVAANVLFNEAERGILSDYLQQCRDRFDEERCWEHGDYDENPDEKPGKKAKTLPPGLEKKLQRGGELPPGWQMKVARGEVLDKGFYRTYSRSLPEEILRRLPAGPEGTSIRRIEDRIVRVNDETLLVLDVLSALGY